MPGPFPGMDPYLESPTCWRGVHQLLAGAITLELNARLPAEFVARMDERLYIVPYSRSVYPDTLVLEPEARPLAAGAGGGAAAAVASPPRMTPPYVFLDEPEEMREPFVEIVTVGAPARVVTVVELLSPANKVVGGEGAAEYRRKQQAILASDAHLLEIDLLRGGAHAVAMSRPLVAARKPFDYIVCLHRAGGGNRYECWPFTLRERMPQVFVPLTTEHPDLVLDLQVCFERVYDGGRYGRSVDYEGRPDPPLSPGDAAWADTLLKARRLRRTSGGEAG